MIIGRRVSGNDRIWLDTTQRIRRLVVDLPEERLAAPVTAAGGRSVRDVLGLLVGTAADAVAGRLHGVLDVEKSASRPVAALMAELDDRAAALAALVRDEPGAGRLLVDLVSVEHDLRTALDEHGARDDDAVVVAVEIMAGVLSERLAEAGVPGLRLTCEQWGHDTAEPCHQILVADRFELFRGLGGRRSAHEIRRWMWSADPGPYLPYFAVYGEVRELPLDEPDPTIPPEYAERLRRQNWREPLPA